MCDFDAFYRIYVPTGYISRHSALLTVICDNNIVSESKKQQLCIKKINLLDLSNACVNMDKRKGKLHTPQTH